MKVIGYRKRGLIILYSFVLMMFILFLIPCLFIKDKKLVILFIISIIGIIMTTVSLIQLLKTPYQAIKLLNDEVVILPKNVAIKIGSISAIYYKRAQSRYDKYKWGKIIIKTQKEKYKVNYIAECEKVADEIARIVNQK